MSHPRRFLSLSLGLSVLLFAGLVWAASVFKFSAQHVTARSPEHVLAVLTAYDKTCAKCFYHAPDMVEFIQLPQKRGATSWYTWSHIKTTWKTVRFFSKVDVTRQPSGDFVMVTHQLGPQDQATIDELKRLTKYEHSPAFDEGTTRFIVKKTTSGKTEVTQAMTLTASGMIAMFGGKIENGMREGAKITFQNIEK